VCYYPFYLPCLPPPPSRSARRCLHFQVARLYSWSNIQQFVEVTPCLLRPRLTFSRNSYSCSKVVNSAGSTLTPILGRIQRLVYAHLSTFSRSGPSYFSC